MTSNRSILPPVAFEAAGRARSFLFVPANRPDRFAKALAARADAVIVDLEDAVPPSEKDAARAALAAWLSPERPVWVRVNGVDTPWFGKDQALVAKPGVAGVVLPKAEDPGQIAAVFQASGGLPVLPLIESAAGIRNVHALARAEGVARLLFGSIDFQVDLGMAAEEEELLSFRLELVLASRLANLAPPVDGVAPAINDLEGLQRDTLRARRLGFGGKLCIHPCQLRIVNRCFAPSPEELAWAQRILAADAEGNGSALALEGQMVDRPVVLRARKILAQAASGHVD